MFSFIIGLTRSRQAREAHAAFERRAKEEREAFERNHAEADAVVRQLTSRQIANRATLRTENKTGETEDGKTYDL